MPMHFGGGWTGEPSIRTNRGQRECRSNRWPPCCSADPCRQIHRAGAGRARDADRVASALDRPVGSITPFLSKRGG